MVRIIDDFTGQIIEVDETIDECITPDGKHLELYVINGDYENATLKELGVDAQFCRTHRIYTTGLVPHDFEVYRLNCKWKVMKFMKWSPTSGDTNAKMWRQPMVDDNGKLIDPKDLSPEATTLTMSRDQYDQHYDVVKDLRAEIESLRAELGESNRLEKLIKDLDRKMMNNFKSVRFDIKHFSSK